MSEGGGGAGGTMGDKKYRSNILQNPYFNLICLSNILEIVGIYNLSNMGIKKALQKIR